MGRKESNQTNKQIIGMIIGRTLKDSHSMKNFGCPGNWKEKL